MPRPSRYLPAAAVLALAAPALAAAGERPVDLFTPAVGPRAPAAAPGEAVKARTRIGTAHLAGATAFTVTLPGASPVVLRVKSAADRPGGVRSVHARSADDKVDAVLVEHDGKLTGSIAAGKRHFRVEPTGPGEADLVEIDEARIVKHGKEPVAPDAIEPTDRARARAAAAATGGDDGGTIDVLVVYDASAPAAVADIQATAQLSVDDYNARLDNSGVTNGHERLVGAVALQHTANANDWGGELSWLTSDPIVAGLRDRYKADLVQELIGTTNAGVIGIGWIGPSQTHAFSVIKAAYAGYGAAHEKGHNMGAHHNVEEDPSTQPYPYQHRAVRF